MRKRKQNLALPFQKAKYFGVRLITGMQCADEIISAAESLDWHNEDQLVEVRAQ